MLEAFPIALGAPPEHIRQNVSGSRFFDDHIKKERPRPSGDEGNFIVTVLYRGIIGNYYGYPHKNGSPYNVFITPRG
ncbi:MAG: hypothetical protein ACLUEQ_09690 [Cloacibacillus evryensis]